MADFGGYDYEVCDEGVYDELLCPVCFKLKRDAIELQCEHSLCSACLQQWEDKAGEMKTEFNCPQCRVPINRKGASKSGIINRIIRTSVKVKCGYFREGCKWTGSISDIEHHTDNLCDYSDVQCSNLDCELLMKRMDLEKHSNECDYRLQACNFCELPIAFIQSEDHLNKCSLYPISCSNSGCSEVLARKLLLDHQSKECYFSLVKCQFSEIGCGTMIIRKDQSDHDRDCVSLHVSLLLSQNMKLREELEETKHHVQYSLGENPHLKSFTEKISPQLIKLEEMVVTFSEKAGEFNILVADCISNISNKSLGKDVFSIFIELHIKAIDLILDHDIDYYRSLNLKQEFEKLTDEYKLSEYTDFMYEKSIQVNEIKKRHKDLVEEYDQVLETVDNALKKMETHEKVIIAQIEITCEKSQRDINKKFFVESIDYRMFELNVSMRLMSRGDTFYFVRPLYKIGWKVQKSTQPEHSEENSTDSKIWFFNNDKELKSAMKIMYDDKFEKLRYGMECVLMVYCSAN